jgi:iron complex transport system substrate-binding protein
MSNSFSMPISELILGGQRSGKLHRAEMLAPQWFNCNFANKVVSIATSQPWNEEMRHLIAHQQADRVEHVPDMLAAEEPVALAESLARLSRPGSWVLVDCLTLWLTKLVMPAGAGGGQQCFASETSMDLARAPVQQFLHARSQAAGLVVLVGNAIGMGVIPLGAKVSAFVEALGHLNARRGSGLQTGYPDGSWSATHTERPNMKLGFRYAALTAFALAVVAWPAQALQVTDDRGITLTFSISPQRIVSLLPSLTESVCALGQCERLIGVDRYSNFPESVKKLPQVGGGMDPNIEAIVALHPDVVLAALSSRWAQRLTALGIRVFALEPKTQADVQRAIGKLAQLLEVPDGQKLWREVDAGVNSASQSIPASVRGTRVYFEVNRGPYGAGEASFIGEMLTRLGVKNILPAKLGPFPLINPELVVRENPDLIMVGESNLDSLEQRPGWSRIRAIREHHVCVFTSAQIDVLVRPGPRMAESARIMAQCLRDKASTAKVLPQ